MEIVITIIAMMVITVAFSFSKWRLHQKISSFSCSWEATMLVTRDSRHLRGSD